ncbi:MAG TPA: sulfurtransferase [Jatrophihabitans sp.]|nr:sulfurtransferase [Jatrophihabitans sp.]
MSGRSRGGSDFGPLVGGEWLFDKLDDVRVVDVRWYLDGRSGSDAYESGHIPGAVWLDVDTDLSEPAAAPDGRHPLATPERFAGALARVGIAEGTPVVAYDDAGGSIAARLWWMLHVLGEPAAVLDGGLAAWPGILTTEVPGPRPVQRLPRAWPEHRFVTADQVESATTSGDAAVFDARTSERFARGDAAIDPRPGHVPGAISAPWAANLDADGRFRDVDALRARFAAAAGRTAITYCGSGVTACHDLLAMELAGLRATALYTGSWSQWGADDSRPAAIGPPGAEI